MEIRAALFTLAVCFLQARLANAVTENGKFCYICNSDTKFNCFHPGYDTKSQKCSYGCVFTMKKWKDGNTVVLRGCGTWQSSHASGCTEVSTTSVITPECMCNTDYCNNAVITPATELQLDRCYRCQYYGSKSAEHLVDTTCLYPDLSTPTALCPYGYCKKIYFMTGDYIGISRMCVEGSSSSFLCTPESTASVRYEVCSCEGDLCNGAVTVSMETTTFLTVSCAIALFGRYVLEFV
ncbi:hypothetical protein LSH36_449g03017 [Paralvinella palmiformis]|uniref:Protein quiver n=1 Tax=Paralvinella palmiformis TaxID=53620 RepID=A0AAD9JAZ3_9ANNE|nr:hypothetical protein LSH36_449g03017 [Paralvinella palmiformis]